MSDVVVGPSRVLRVFVSSTFRDMQDERDELAKRVFPAVRDLCESRGVIWGEVDLRWGITDEQVADGEVLPICLAEIYNGRPYFWASLASATAGCPSKSTRRWSRSVRGWPSTPVAR